MAYFRGANGIMLVFDLTVRASFQAVESWVRDIDKNADRKVAKILVGNKADLADADNRRAVTAAEATKVAEQHGMTYIETSAKSGVNVDEAFEKLAALALGNVKKEKAAAEDSKQAAAPAKTVNLSRRADAGEAAEKKKGCC